jgi:hypothetical protein
MTNLRVRWAAAVLAILFYVVTAAGFTMKAVAGNAPTPFLPDIIISSTIPPKGDLNPYGVAIVPAGFPSGGKIMPGDVLVSNFNNKTNAQGTGTTIIKLTPNGLVAPPGTATTFFQGSRVGLTTALGVLRRGFVLVGNVPTSGGVIQKPGSLLFLDRSGKEIAPSPYTNRLNGPWDLTIHDMFDHALVFVSNVNNGTVTRLNLTISPTAVSVASATVIASGYRVKPNPAALILGPTGVAYDAATDTLYVASTADNLIFAVPNAGSRTGSSGRGTVAFRDEHLRGPLALVFASNGDLLAANGDAVNPDPTQPSEIVEFTKQGKFVAQFNVDAGQGGAFGIGVAEVGPGIVRFVFIDDNANDVTVLDRAAVSSN